MKYILRNALLVIGFLCFMGQVANAQRLQQDIIGYWTISKMDIQMADTDKSTDAEREQFEAMKTLMMAGFEATQQQAFFDFKKDGTVSIFDEEKGSTQGTWTVVGNKLSIQDNGEEGTETFDIKIEKGVMTLKMPNTEIPNVSVVIEMKKRK
jgi:hypothetical protein